MSFYGNLAETATRLIRQYGQTVTVTTLAAVTAVPTTRTPKAVFVEEIKTAVDGDSGVKQGDWIVLMEVSGAPVQGDIMLRGSVKYLVVFAEPIQPADTILAYEVTVRRG